MDRRVASAGGRTFRLERRGMRRQLPLAGALMLLNLATWVGVAISAAQA